MPRVRDGDVLGALDRLVHLLAQRRRRDRILLADHDERRHVDGREQRRRVGRVISAVIAFAIASVELDTMSARTVGRRQAACAASARPGVSGSFRRPPPPALSRAPGPASCAAPPRLPACRPAAVCRRAPGPDVARRMPHQRERDVAAHREAADDRVFDVQGVEKVDDVTGVLVHGGGRLIRAAAVHSAELGTITRQPFAASASCGSASGRSRKRVNQGRVPRGRSDRRRRLRVAETSNDGHSAIVTTAGPSSPKERRLFAPKFTIVNCKFTGSLLRGPASSDLGAPLKEAPDPWRACRRTLSRTSRCCG